MKTIAFLHPPPTDKGRQVLEDTLGSAWVNSIEWVDCEAVPRHVFICNKVERLRPDVVLALGNIAARVLPQVRQICHHPFLLFSGCLPAPQPYHAVQSVLKRLRTELDVQLNAREGGACK